MSASISCCSSSCTQSSYYSTPPSSSLVSVSPNCTSSWMMLTPPPSTSRALSLALPTRRPSNGVVRCEVAVQVSSSQEEESESESSSDADKVGSRVRVKVPLKVYHVPKVAELDLNGMEGEIKQYVAIWNGKRISANLPYKVEFITDVEGRGRVKFFAHLKEDEFEFV